VSSLPNREAQPVRGRTIATRVLASFGVTLLAFAITVGWSIVAQRRAARDSDELSKGYVPVALKLGQLRATQATLSTLVDGIPDERDPVSARLLLGTLSSTRRAKFLDTRAALTQLEAVGSGPTQGLATELTGELSSIETQLDADKAALEQLFTAIDSGDKDSINGILISLGAVEHDGDQKLHALADRLGTSMDALSADARERELRSIFALVFLAILTLGVGIAVSLQTRRLLAPLAEVTQRARAVARGDLTPKEVHPSDDELGELSAAFEQMVGAVGKAQSQAVANERLAAIGKMAAHVTHEIRNPLSAIGLNVELLEEELAEQGEAKALLTAIAREVGRLENLSEEYLRLARLPSPRMEEGNVATLVTDVVQFTKKEMERANCTVVVAPSGERVPSAMYDESQIRQALLNLLRNAREAMQDGGTIDVSVRALGMSVVIQIEDRGSGIPDEIRTRVFDPFFSTKGEGTGLGLAITRRIVEAHGGTITAEPREGGGTTFAVALPIAPARETGTV
jgi:two-component system, NtrC family, sensor kinase